MVPIPSYPVPVDHPTSDGRTGPFVCAPIPIDWLQAVVGALSQLRNASIWKYTTNSELDGVMHAVDWIIGQIATAAMCDEKGSSSLTILAGAASATTAITFPFAFTAAPVVVCSCGNPALLASPQSITSSGFDLTITADVPQLINVTADAYWFAGPAT
jgi:hypothetical protein